MEYKPCPLQLNDISLPEDIQEIIEQIAEDVHETWAQSRMKEGWRYGQDFDRKEKTHPCLVPYDQTYRTADDSMSAALWLSDNKEYSRREMIL